MTKVYAFTMKYGLHGEKALKYYSDLAVESDAICDRALVTYDADPFASLFIDNCMALAKTLKEGGM